MALKDPAADIVAALNGETLASVALVTGTNLFAGEVPNEDFVSNVPTVGVLNTGGAAPSPYIGSSLNSFFRASVQITVRGAPSQFANGEALARAVMGALHLSRPDDSYVTVKVQESQPSYFGTDNSQRPQWTFNLEAQYTEFVTSISPGGQPVRVIQASNVTVDPTGNLSSTDVQAALEELQGDIDGMGSGITIGSPANGLSLVAEVLSLALATTGVAGALSAADKTKLDAITGTNTGDVSIGTANGLSLVGQVLSLALATSGTPGALSAADKTKLDAISGTNTGDLSLGTANGLSLVGQALSLALATSGTPGALSAADKTKLDTLSTPGASDHAGQDMLAKSLLLSQTAGSNALTMVTNARLRGDGAAGSSYLRYNGTAWELSGSLVLGTSATDYFQVGNNTAVFGRLSNLPGLWFGVAEADRTFLNYAFLSTGTETLINGPSGGALHIRVGNSTKAAINASGIAPTDPLIYKGATGITAFAGGGQGSATAISSEVNHVTTVASANDSVKLPTAALGLRIVVFNLGANACNVFPVTGGAIDALGTNAAYSLAAGASREFWGQSSTAWRSR